MSKTLVPYRKERCTLLYYLTTKGIEALGCRHPPWDHKEISLLNLELRQKKQRKAIERSQTLVVD